MAEPSQQAALRHEWSHVRNRDSASLQLATAVQLLFFYQPIYWILRRRMILSQDLIADALAVSTPGQAPDYAEFLIQIASSRLRPRVPQALGIVDFKSHLWAAAS